MSADFRHAYDPKDPALFERLGYPEIAPLARGMEAAAYALPGDLVGKVWGKRTAGDVRRLQCFYDDVADRDLPFASPQLLQVHAVEGVVVSIERRLPGKPFSSDGRSNETAGIERLIGVLEALRSVDVPSVCDLPAIGDQRSPWTSESPFTAGLVALLDRRIERFGEQMRRSVEQFDEKALAIKERLHQSVSTERCLFHGDLGGGNLLVDEDFNVVSVLDFGFLSGSGDPRFDASITSGVFDMWSSRAQLRQHQFDVLLERDFGYEREALLIFRAAYAIIVANAYDASGKDGQFWWSSTLLNRPDIHELLLS